MAAGQQGFITLTLSDGGGLRAIQRSIATWGIALTTLEQPLTEIGLDLEGDFMLNMIGGGGLFMDGANGAAGAKWAPLAPSTVAEKQRLGYGDMPIMWRTGALAESLAYRGAPGNIFVVGADFLSVGTSIPYARYHQEGGEHLPRRLLVGLSWNRLALIVRRVNDYVQQQARLAGLAIFGG